MMLTADRKSDFLAPTFGESKLQQSMCLGVAGESCQRHDTRVTVAATHHIVIDYCQDVQKE